MIKSDEWYYMKTVVRKIKFQCFSGNLRCRSRFHFMKRIRGHNENDFRSLSKRRHLMCLESSHDGPLYLELGYTARKKCWDGIAKNCAIFPFKQILVLAGVLLRHFFIWDHELFLLYTWFITDRYSLYTYSILSAIL